MDELEIHILWEHDEMIATLEEQHIMLAKWAMTEKEHKITCDAIVAEYEAHVANLLQYHWEYYDKKRKISS